MKVQNILETIGNTPHVKINRLFGEQHQVWIKLERANPGASIKDRIAYSMVRAAEKAGALKPGMKIVEATSGNTGIGLAMVGAVLGYPVTIVMPESMSLERRQYLKALGAEVVLTPKEGGMKAAISKAQEIINEAGKWAWEAKQFENPANPAVHRTESAREITDDFKRLDYLITGVGTGGHITGCSQVLKDHYPDLQVLAVEPEDSAVINGEPSGPHPLQGIGPGFIPENLDLTAIDGAIKVSKAEAFEYARRCAREEGIFVGISTGASLAAVAKKLPEIKPGSVVLTYCYDSGERYFSVADLF